MSSLPRRGRTQSPPASRRLWCVLALVLVAGLAVAEPSPGEMPSVVYLPLIAAYAGLVLFFRAYRQWLFFYVAGAFGLALILVFGLRSTGIELTLIQTEVEQLVAISNWLGIGVEALTGYQLILSHEGSSAILEMGIECSALLEMSILASLVLFYPAFTLRFKLLALALGLAGTYLANLARMMIILTLANDHGPSSIFVGHAIVGRLFFFTMVIGLYWFIITRPTVRAISREIERRAD